MKRKRIFTIAAVLTFALLILIMGSILVYESKTKLTRERVIAEFEDNKEHFILIKDFMLSQEEDYYMRTEEYRTEISDEKVLISLKRLIEQVGYERIYNNSYITDLEEAIIVNFTRGSNDNDEFGIVYLGYTGATFGQYSEYIGDGWYYYWVGYV